MLTKRGDGFITLIAPRKAHAVTVDRKRLFGIFTSQPYDLHPFVISAARTHHHSRNHYGSRSRTTAETHRTIS